MVLYKVQVGVTYCYSVQTVTHNSDFHFSSVDSLLTEG